jgi:uncharacterized membrane-anchored protein
LQAALPPLERVRSSLHDASSADLGVLLGHTKAILDRRERVDRFTRTLTASPARLHIEAARAAYERAARRQYARVVSLRIVAIQLASVGCVLLLRAAALVGWLRRLRPV